LGVIVDQAQVFHGLAPLGQDGGIQDQAIVRCGLPPVQLPPQIGKKTPVKRPPTPFGLLKAIEGVLLALNQGLERPVQQIMDSLDMRKNQIGQDKQELNRRTAFPFTDTGAGEMRFDVQQGKQFLDPQFQIAPELLQSCFDLPLKTSDLSVMQREAPFLWFR
jgi:hypothetical protein